LKRVAEVAPKEMGLIFNGPNDDDGNPTAEEWAWRYEVEFPETPVYYDGDLGRRSALLVLEDDLYDAQACFAMLDAMEDAGFYTGVWTRFEYGGFGNSQLLRGGYSAEALKGPDDKTIKGHGTTRAEAISRAFVAVFGAKKQEGPRS
jgi:hypothetical protein